MSDPEPILFADDTSLFHAHINFHTIIDEVNTELHKIAVWPNTNKRTLNVNKVKFYNSYTKRKRI